MFRLAGNSRSGGIVLKNDRKAISWNPLLNNLLPSMGWKQSPGSVILKMGGSTLCMVVCMGFSVKPCWVVWTFSAMLTYPLIYLNLSRCFNAVVKCTIVHLCPVIICSTFERKQIYFSRKILCRKFSFILFKICLDGGIFYKVFLYAFSFFWCRLT